MTVAIPYDKPALTFDQQLALLESRGLDLGDRALARQALERIGYYRLSAYWLPFKCPDDSFIPGATFARALEFYEFDRRLRLLVLDAIEQVEVLMRTRIVYTLAHVFGPFAHCRAENFVWTFDHAAWNAKVEKEVLRGRELFLKHYQKTYLGFPRVPIWMTAETMSLGNLSVLFKHLRPSEQEEVGAPWRPVHRTVLESWFHVITVIRNACAHHARLWNRDLGVTPKMPKRWNAPWSRKIYTVLCILRELTKSSNGESWARAIAQMLWKLDGDPWWQEQMGIPSSWKTSSFWSATTSDL